MTYMRSTKSPSPTRKQPPSKAVFYYHKIKTTGGKHMEFFNSAIEVLQTLVIALGAGLAVWGAINLLEGYGNDNPGANAHVR